MFRRTTNRALARGCAAGLIAVGVLTGCAQPAQPTQPPALASATPFLRLMSLTAGGTYLAKGALSEDASSPRVALARFFAENLLTEAAGLSETVQGGAQSVLVDAHGPLFA